MAWVTQDAPEVGSSTDRGITVGDDTARGMYTDDSLRGVVFDTGIGTWTPLERSVT